MKERPILFSAPMVRAILAGTKVQTRRVVKPQPIYDGRFAGGWKLLGKAGHEAATCSPLVYEMCPYGHPGDRLWVRETWRHTANSLDEARAITEDITSGTAVDYRATYIETCKRELGFSQEDAVIADSFERWRPSIHMPRWASRITLEITGVRVERLQAVSESDAIAEGICPHEHAVGPIGEHIESVRCIHCEGLRRDHVGVAMACFGGMGTTWNGNTARGGYAVLWDQINGLGSWASNPWVWVIEFKRVERGE